MIEWIRSWWTTWRVWRSMDAQQRSILTSRHPFDPDDFVDAPRPS